MENKKRFFYNMEMETALTQVFENKYKRDAGIFEDPKNLKIALKDWILKIQRRVIEVTPYDLRLRQMIIMDLNSIKRDVNAIPQEYPEWKIIPKLMTIVSRLLGYDWCEGKINREVFYNQNFGQEYKDYINSGKTSREKLFGFYDNINLAHLDLIEYLESKGYDLHQISTLLKISESTLLRLKKRYGKHEKKEKK